MRVIELNRRQARVLRENLTSNQEGYDFTDLCRLDNLAKKLTTLQGEYAERMAELAREEKSARRLLVRATTPQETEAANRKLLTIQFEAEDLHETAEAVQIELKVEDGDYKLITDKVDNVGKWLATDEMRPTIIGMVQAIKDAKQESAQ